MNFTKFYEIVFVVSEACVKQFISKNKNVLYEYMYLKSTFLA